MGLDIQNGALGAEHEQNKNVGVILQNSTDSTYIETGLRISISCDRKSCVFSTECRIC